MRALRFFYSLESGGLESLLPSLIDILSHHDLNSESLHIHPPFAAVCS